MGVFSKFREGFRKGAGAIRGVLGAIGGGRLDQASMEDLEEALYASDFGVQTTEQILEEIREAHRGDKNLRGQDVATIARALPPGSWRPVRVMAVQDGRPCAAGPDAPLTRAVYPAQLGERAEAFTLEAGDALYLGRLGITADLFACDGATLTLRATEGAPARAAAGGAPSSSIKRSIAHVSGCAQGCSTTRWTSLEQFRSMAPRLPSDCWRVRRRQGTMELSWHWSTSC